MIIKKHTKISEEKAKQEKQKPEVKAQEENVDLFDLDNIDFTQRQERRLS